jgi:hypothetical protein
MKAKSLGKASVTVEVEERRDVPDCIELAKTDHVPRGLVVGC